MPTFLGTTEVTQMHYGNSEVKRLYKGATEIWKPSNIGFNRSIVAWGTGGTAGAVWKFQRTKALGPGFSSFTRICDGSDGGAGEATQQIPTTYMADGDEAYVLDLTYTDPGVFSGIDNGQIQMNFASGSSFGSSTSGIMLTEDAEDNLGLVFFGSGNSYKFRLSDLDNLDESNPYRWRPSSPWPSIASDLQPAGATGVLVDISNSNVDWDNLTFTSL